MKEKKILCRNKSERDAVLKKLEEQGVRWINGNDKPTEWECYEWDENSEIVLVVGDENALWWGYAIFYKGKREKLIPAKEFLRQFKTKPILIYRNGRAVYAEDKNTGLVGTTICSPDDTFDFQTGAMIALCRLVKGDISEDAKAEMRKVLGEEKKPEEDDIKVGDKVKIVDTLQSYRAYCSWFKKYEIDMNLAIKYAYSKEPQEGIVCTVKSIQPHCTFPNKKVYLVEVIGIVGECYLMSREGFVKL